MGAWSDAEPVCSGIGRRGAVEVPYRAVFSKGSVRILSLAWCVGCGQPVSLNAGVREGRQRGWPVDVGRMEESGMSGPPQLGQRGAGGVGVSRRV